jgi:hypothetical protein
MKMGVVIMTPYSKKNKKMGSDGGWVPVLSFAFLILENLKYNFFKDIPAFLKSS